MNETTRRDAEHYLLGHSSWLLFHTFSFSYVENEILSGKLICLCQTQIYIFCYFYDTLGYSEVVKKPK